jgi:parallel beta helix pectate lyase-like protein
MRGFTRPRRFSLIMVFAMALSVYAQGTNLKVNCDGRGALSTINRALKLLNPQGPNTLTVSGSCHENVVIQSFDRLTLTANLGATITDASGGNGVVVDIEDSTRISLQGFTINGGNIGVLCSDFSLCRFKENTVHNAINDGLGMYIVRSHASFDHDVIEDNNGDGLDVINESTVVSDGLTVQRNGGEGVFVGFESFMVVRTATVQGNAGNGIFASQNSSVAVVSSNITRNGGNGVFLAQASTAVFRAPLGPSSITNNGASGVLLRDLSFGQFEGSGNQITGNNTATGGVGNDVTCNPQFSATRGALTNIGGGTTNCVEP